MFHLWLLNPRIFSVLLFIGAQFTSLLPPLKTYFARWIIPRNVSSLDRALKHLFPAIRNTRTLNMLLYFTTTAVSREFHCNQTHARSRAPISGRCSVRPRHSININTTYRTVLRCAAPRRRMINEMRRSMLQPGFSCCAFPLPARQYRGMLRGAQSWIISRGTALYTSAVRFLLWCPLGDRLAWCRRRAFGIEPFNWLSSDCLPRVNAAPVGPAGHVFV